MKFFPHAYWFKDGYLHPGDKPGLSVDFDEKLAAKFPYERAYLPVNRKLDGLEPCGTGDDGTHARQCSEDRRPSTGSPLPAGLRVCVGRDSIFSARALQQRRLRWRSRVVSCKRRCVTWGRTRVVGL